MDKNKGHKDAKDFFRLLNADKDQQHRDLDEFDLEALEGWKLVKDRAKAKEISDSNIDKKLEELLAEEKEERPLVIGDQTEKKRSKTGLYMLSIAASLVLLLGLFFVFKGFNKQADMAENKDATGISGKDMEPPMTPLEEKLKETNSDERIATEKGPSVKADENSQVPLEEPMTTTTEGYYMNSADTSKVNPVAMGEVAELELQSVVEEKNLDVDLKKDEQKYETTKGKKVAESTKNPARKEEETVSDQFYKTTDDVTFSDKSKLKNEEDREQNKKMKSRGVLKKQTTTKDNMAVAGPPAMNDQKVPAQMSDSTVVSTKPSIATASGATTLTQSNTNTLSVTTPGGGIPTYSWNNGNAKAANVVEAEFTGGKTVLDAYIKKNLKVPESCASEEVIVVKFLINEKGLVSKPKIVSKTGNCPDCEKEAIRFIKAMPAWIAATQDGKGISSYKTIALSFKK